jgi:hypothetical protein
VRHPGHGFDGHGDHLMAANAGGGGYEADAARVVLTGRIERGCCAGGGVSSVMLTGTGRVDPLPIGGHGVS